MGTPSNSPRSQRRGSAGSPWAEGAGLTLTAAEGEFPGAPCGRGLAGSASGHSCGPRGTADWLRQEAGRPRSPFPDTAAGGTAERPAGSRTGRWGGGGAAGAGRRGGRGEAGPGPGRGGAAAWRAQARAALRLGRALGLRGLSAAAGQQHPPSPPPRFLFFPSASFGYPPPFPPSPAPSPFLLRRAPSSGP